MEFKGLKFAAALLAAVLAGCNGQPSITIHTNSDSVTKGAASVLNDASMPDSAQIVSMIAELYNDYVFGSKEFDEAEASRFCTKRMAEKLKADYDFEGGGYAVWDFRTDAQDGAEGDGLKSISKKAENVYSAVIYDNGVKADVDLFIVIEDGTCKIGAVDVAYTKKCDLCGGTKQMVCPSCKGEGFIATPSEEQGEDWGRACFTCGGSGYGHKHGNDATLKLGKGYLPCDVCVKVIMVDVPKSNPLKTLEKLDSDFEKKLVGDHGVRLQWVSDTKLGNVKITKLSDGLYSCVGKQLGDGNDDYVMLDGQIKVVNPLQLIFEGTIECRVSHIYKGKPYIRKGTMEFLNTKGRKFWRLQQMDNGDCTDYVDIYM